MLIKYSSTYIGEIEIPNDLSDEQISELIEERALDTIANEIDWEEVKEEVNKNA